MDHWSIHNMYKCIIRAFSKLFKTKKKLRRFQLFHILYIICIYFEMKASAAYINIIICTVYGKLIVFHVILYAGRNTSQTRYILNRSVRFSKNLWAVGVSPNCCKFIDRFSSAGTGTGSITRPTDVPCLVVVSLLFFFWLIYCPPSRFANIQSRIEVEPFSFFQPRDMSNERKFHCILPYLSPGPGLCLHVSFASNWKLITWAAPFFSLFEPGINLLFISSPFY